MASVWTPWAMSLNYGKMDKVYTKLAVDLLLASSIMMTQTKSSNLAATSFSTIITSKSAIYKTQITTNIKNRKKATSLSLASMIVFLPDFGLSANDLHPFIIINHTKHSIISHFFLPLFESSIKTLKKLI